MKVSPNALAAQAMQQFDKEQQAKTAQPPVEAPKPQDKPAADLSRLGHGPSFELRLSDAAARALTDNAEPPAHAARAELIAQEALRTQPFGHIVHSYVSREVPLPAGPKTESEADTPQQLDLFKV